MITHKKKINSADTLKTRRFRFLLAPIVLLTSSLSLAAELVITAKFAPDPTNPNAKTFKNTTPNSGYCQKYPMQCVNGAFSLEVKGLTTLTASIEKYHADKKDGAMLKVPADWRAIEVISDSGEIRKLEVRITGFGARYNVSPSVRTITSASNIVQAHGALWEGGSWGVGAPPCTYSGGAYLANTSYVFFWLTPSGIACGKMARFDIPNFHFDDINIMYELRTPSPLEMPAGEYSGILSYTVGPGGDFDFGNVLIPSDDKLNLNFSLSVVHHLAVRFPPGAHNLTLVPAGGWLQWINRGRRPEKLSADQNFNIWSSGSFKMLLQCEHAIGNQCGIQTKDGHSVPVETRVTLPSGVLTETKTPANRHLLTTDPSNFHSSIYVNGGKANLEFEVGRGSLQEMTENAGKQYTGDVTVIWEPGI